MLTKIQKSAIVVAHFDYQIVIKCHHRIPFNILAAHYPPLQKHILIFGQRLTIDFSNQQSLNHLTAAFLKYLFGITWWNIPGHLCPRLPGRLNYLLWMNKALDYYIQSSSQQQTKARTRIFEIGTGASLVYPLIGAKMFPQWDFVATEADPVSIQNARRLLQQNKLGNRITLKLSLDKMILGHIENQQPFMALMCNPPFFDDQESTFQRVSTPLSQMSAQEYKTSGGQIEFFFKIFNQSLGIGRSRINLFTSLLGRATSYQWAKQFLLSQKEMRVIDRFTYGVISQGENLRFVIGWVVPDQTVYTIQQQKKFV